MTSMWPDYLSTSAAELKQADRRKPVTLGECVSSASSIFSQSVFLTKFQPLVKVHLLHSH